MLPIPYYSKDTCLLFLHLPKTAGMTLYSYLDQQFPSDQNYTFDYSSIDKSLHDLQSLSEEKRNSLRLIKGHYHFGIHEFINSPVTYMTFLREPVDRALSFYYFARELKTHPLYSIINKERLTLEKFLDSEHATHINDFQTRALSGMACDFFQYNDEAIKMAKHHLTFHFCLVGLVEEFDASVILLQNILGTSNARYKSQNRTSKRQSSKNISSKIIHRIRELNQMDLEVYDHAKYLFQYQVNRQGPTFKKQLRHFQIKNQALQKIRDTKKSITG